MKKVLLGILSLSIILAPTVAHTLFLLATTPSKLSISYPSNQYDLFAENHIKLSSETLNLYSDAPDKGLFFTTVIVEEKPTALEVLIARLIGEAEIFSLEENTVVVYDIPTTIMDYYEDEIDVSLKFALASALDYTKIPYGSSLDIADVTLILEDGKTVNDEYVTLLEINGVKISRFEEVETYLKKLENDDPVELKIRRINGDELDMLVTPTFSKTLERYSLGFYVLPRFIFPLDFEFNVPRVQGGSAGIMLSLAATEALTKERILPNLKIGGTGAIDSSGDVIEISSLRQKIISGYKNENDVFIFPASMCEKDLITYKEMALLPVETLSNAIEQLNNFASGKKYATCQDY